MSYFIHNRYDKNSINTLAGIDSNVITIIDYFADYDTYKYLDVSAGFGILYETLSYITPDAVIYDGQSANKSSHFNFRSSVFIKSIQRGIISVTKGVEVKVSIFDIDPSKSFVILNASSSASGISGPLIQSLDKATLSLYSYGGSGSVSYQIIEFA